MFGYNTLGFGSFPSRGVALNTIGRSALFQSANSTSLNRTFDSGGNRKTWTSSIWYTRGGKNGGDNSLFTGYGNGSQGAGYYISNDTSVDTLNFYNNYASSAWNTYFVATPKFRDISAWYHIVVVFDSTDSTETDRMRAYVNGERITEFSAIGYPSLNLDGFLNQAQQYCVGSLTNSAYYMDGYIAETVFIDGAALEPSSFGEYDESGTYWMPKKGLDIKALTFGTNGFYLDNAADPETDASGEGHDFTDVGTVTTSTHTPTNLNAVWNPLSAVGLTTRFPLLTIGNTKAGWTGSTSGRAMPTFPVFFNTHLEFTVTQGSGASSAYPYLQVFDYNGDSAYTALVSQSSAGGGSGTGLAGGASIPNWTTGDRVTLEIDTANGRIYVWIDGSAVNSANPSAGSGYTFDFTMPASGNLAIAWINQTSAGFTTIVSNPDDFTDSVSSGYYGLTSTVIAEQVTRTGRDVSEYFETIIRTGNNTETAVAVTDGSDNSWGPDLVWQKERGGTIKPQMYDSIRGPLNMLFTDVSNAQAADNADTGLIAFTSTGFTLGSAGSNGGVNSDSQTEVYWCFKGGGTPTADNSESAGAAPTSGSVMIDGVASGAALAGSIAATKISANTEWGFSVVGYTGTGSNATVAHGLGVAPEMIIVKNITQTDAWWVYHSHNSTAPSTNYLVLNTTAATVDNAAAWNDTEPTSSVFSVGSAAMVNGSSEAIIAYCFAPSPYTSFGEYEGNGNANGVFVPTTNSEGIMIQPTFVIVKSIDSTSNWEIYDDKRLGYNVENAHLDANTTTAESAADNLDILTGGFKMRVSSDPNVGETYMYMAFGKPMIDPDGRILTAR